MKRSKINGRDRMLGRILLVATTTLAIGACGVRPSGPPAPTGVKLRITHRYCVATQRCDTPAQVAHEGELIFASFDTVAVYSLKDQREYAVPVGEISRLEVFRGRRGSAKAAAKGLAKGAILGALGGAVIGASSAAAGAVMGSSQDAGEQIAAGAAGGAVIGAAAGAVDGVTNGDRVWQEITIRRLLQDLCRCQEPERARPDTTPSSSSIP
jgi:hypothetical protein